MMYPRLRLARELLSDDGVIFISIDDNELNNAKKISDEIFGEDNFAAQFMWTKTMTPPALAYKCRKTVEYVLCYEKVANKSKFFGSWLENGDAPLLNSGNPVKELKFPAGTIRIGFLNRGSIPSGHYEGADILETIYVENGVNSNEAVLKGSFKWSQDTLEEEVSLGTYFLIKTNKMSVRFQRADGERYKTPTNYLPIKLDNSNGVGTNESASSDLDRLGMSSLFDYTKPKSLITTLVKMRCFLSGDDVVCDFFSGSSTTAVAIMELNEEDGGSRKSISIQLAEEIKPSSSDDAKKRELTNRRISFLDSLDRPHLLTEIGEERIRRAGNKIKAEVEEANKKLPDIGFRVFTLDNSGIEKPEPGKLVLDVVKPDRSDMDIVFEMMLKWGLELTLPVEQEEAADYPIYSVACGELVCCLAPGLTIEALEAIADIEPRRVLMRDSILTDSLKLNAAQVFKRVAEKTGREVELRTV